MRWVGIDEAGYGPNLGPMVMTAVVAETPAAAATGASSGFSIDFWNDLAATVDRAGGDPDRVWIDDSKAILQGGKGRDRLEIAALAAIHATRDELPGCLEDLVALLGAGSPADVELVRWKSAETKNGDWPPVAKLDAVLALVERRPFVSPIASWRIAAVLSVVVGPAQFNGRLEDQGSKAAVHFEAFDRLLKQVWERAADGRTTFVLGDKHGGRHYYMRPLSQAFPEAWIDRGREGPELSRYTIRDQCRRLELSLMPRADQCDGLVALASIVSKTVRELWMDVFNEYWRRRIPDLRPTAGYPSDATRFRREIEASALAEGHDPAHWWRVK
jgi:ribonuclease HII